MIFIYNWMHTLWEKKVAASPSHESIPLDEEYLLLTKDDILRLEKDFHDEKLRFPRGEKEFHVPLKERFQEFLNTAKRYVESNYVIYYEAR